MLIHLEDVKAIVKICIGITKVRNSLKCLSFAIM